MRCFTSQDTWTLAIKSMIFHLNFRKFLFIMYFSKFSHCFSVNFVLPCTMQTKIVNSGTHLFNLTYNYPSAVSTNLRSNNSLGTH